MSLRESYIAYIKAENAEGSNRASSYIRAIELLDSILRRKASKELNAESIWSITSARHIQSLYELILEHQKLGEDGLFKNEKPVSYWRDGFCSAALKSYKELLVTHLYKQQLWEIYQDPKLAAEELPGKLARKRIKSVELLLDDHIDPKSREGRDAIRSVKVRVGQGFFRDMILKHYGAKCCVTGLNVPEVLRASHISGWATDSKNRLNPANGLCLSATYDAAFDKHLISFDDDYRMILSPALKDHYTNKAFKEYFRRLEGKGISKPKRNSPALELLRKHRKRMPV